MSAVLFFCQPVQVIFQPGGVGLHIGRNAGRRRYLGRFVVGGQPSGAEFIGGRLR